MAAGDKKGDKKSGGKRVRRVPTSFLLPTADRGLDPLPPLAGVSLIEFKDQLSLKPYFWCREVAGLGKIKTSKLRRKSRPRAIAEGLGCDEIWFVAAWQEFEDGSVEVLREQFLIDASETEARKALEREIRFIEMPHEELETLAQLLNAKDEDLAYVASRLPEKPPGRSLNERDLHQARMTVLAGLHPATVRLVHKSTEEDSSMGRRSLEKQAVESYFAELAHYWTEQQILDWQRTNPVGSGTLTYFAKVRREPRRALDPINHELALNWMKMRYAQLTEKELAQVLQRATQENISQAAAKKRRERLGLTTERPTGPRPNIELGDDSLGQSGD